MSQIDQRPCRETSTALQSFIYDTEHFHCHFSSGATEGNRTPDPLITNQLLCQLSYGGAHPKRTEKGDFLGLPCICLPFREKAIEILGFSKPITLKKIL
jgi:hypothetical protein